MLRVIECGIADLPPTDEVDVLVVLGDRMHPVAAKLLAEQRSNHVARFFVYVRSRRSVALVPIDDEAGVIAAACNLGALPAEILPPGEVCEVHALLAAGLAEWARDAAMAGSLAATAAEGSA